MTGDKEGVQWALPPGLDIEPDQLQARLDIYQESILLHLRDGNAMQVRLVSALDIARVLTAQLGFGSGVLPEGALWWGSIRGQEMVAVWRGPRVWKAALQVEALKPPRRFRLPMPGLIFVCTKGQPPAVFAAKERPQSMETRVYHAPLFNVYSDGRSCQGTHAYPEDPAKQPESFFQAFFSPSVMNRPSQKYGRDLLRLWEEIDGQDNYPVDDLVEIGPFQQAVEGLWR